MTTRVEALIEKGISRLLPILNEAALLDPEDERPTGAEMREDAREIVLRMLEINFGIEDPR